MMSDQKLGSNISFRLPASDLLETVGKFIEQVTTRPTLVAFNSLSRDHALLLTLQ